MSTPPQPNLMRGLVLGLVLSVIGIGLFVFLYLVVFADSATATRLLASLCVPPAIMAVLIGGYVLVTGGANPKS